MNKEGAKSYSKCKDIPREKFINFVSDGNKDDGNVFHSLAVRIIYEEAKRFERTGEVAKSLGDSYDLLPLYEHGMFKHAFIEHYSMDRNQHLSCRWKDYKMNIESRVFAPFQLPDVKELHFHNNAIRYRPEDSIIRQDQRKKLKPGPGVDHIGGQRPIPQELHMKRGTSSVIPVNVKGKKAGKGKCAKGKISKE